MSSSEICPPRAPLAAEPDASVPETETFRLSSNEWICMAVIAHTEPDGQSIGRLLGCEAWHTRDLQTIDREGIDF